MQLFRSTSIESRLKRLIITVSLLVVLCAVAAFSTMEVLSFRNATISKVTSFSNMIAANTAEALLFSDSPVVFRTLAALESEPWALEGLVFDHRGALVARYQNTRVLSVAGRKALFSQCRLLETPEALQHPGDCLTADHYARLTPIVLDGETLGSIYLKWDISPLYRQLLLFAIGALVLSVVLVLIGYGLGVRFQRVISSPIQALAQAMRRVSRDGDYSLRTQTQGPDEIRALSEYFNEMLAAIEERDRLLDEHRLGLEHEVDIRTRDLIESNRALSGLNHNLEEARAEAMVANQAKSQFLANMSHEIRTPMVGVLGMAELLMGLSLEEKPRALVATIKSSGDALLEILDGILDISKIESGKLELEQGPFELQPLVEEAVGLFAEQAHSKRLDILCDFSADPPLFLLGDSGRLRQVLLNLIGNAVKFTQRGEILMRCRLLEEDRHWATVRFEVRDTGIGMDQEACERIFQSFTQADSTTTRRFGGTGLGLTIVQQLIELMGGKIEVVSAPGQGSRFHFHLRLRKQSDVCPLVPQVSMQVRRGRILIVDDHAATRSCLRKSLVAMGLRVESATDDSEALAMLRQAERLGEPYALALLDATMEGLCGFELAEVIRADKELVSTRLAVMSSMHNEKEFPLPGVFVLEKPLRKSAMPGWLSMVLAQQPRQETLKGISDPVDVTSTSSLLKGSVLLAEDNVTTCELIRLLLEPTGIELTVVGEGQQVLQACESRSFDLILMDWHMPGMDGVEAARALRQRGDCTPVIALSANAREEDVQVCLSAGMDAHLSKPFRQHQLFSLLHHWIGKSSPPSALKCPRVLLVEDSLATQELVRLILQERRIELDVVSTASEALEATRSINYDLVLLDYNLPDMTGPDVASSMRADALTLPIVAMTAHTGSEHRMRCLEAGMNDCLTKPFRQQQLLQLIERWVGRTTTDPEPFRLSSQDLL